MEQNYFVFRVVIVEWNAINFKAKKCRRDKFAIRNKLFSLGGSILTLCYYLIRQRSRVRVINQQLFLKTKSSGLVKALFKVKSMGVFFYTIASSKSCLPSLILRKLRHILGDSWAMTFWPIPFHRLFSLPFSQSHHKNANWISIYFFWL